MITSGYHKGKKKGGLAFYFLNEMPKSLLNE
jgi:hypothetical protein